MGALWLELRVLHDLGNYRWEEGLWISSYQLLVGCCQPQTNSFYDFVAVAALWHSWVNSEDTRTPSNAHSASFWVCDDPLESQKTNSSCGTCSWLHDSGYWFQQSQHRWKLELEIEPIRPQCIMWPTDIQYVPQRVTFVWGITSKWVLIECCHPESHAAKNCTAKNAFMNINVFSQLHLR